MKKTLLMVAILAMASVATAMAQPRAIGGRIGYGLEVSYQHGLGDNMLTIEAGVPGFYSGQAVVTYDWINPFNTSIPWDEKGSWNWSLGVGGAVGGSWVGKYVYIGAVGRVNVEYSFWFPLQLAVDFRPMLGVGFGKDYVGFAWDAYAGGIGISARYLF